MKNKILKYKQLSFLLLGIFLIIIAVIFFYYGFSNRPERISTWALSTDNNTVLVEDNSGYKLNGIPMNYIGSRQDGSDIIYISFIMLVLLPLILGIGSIIYSTKLTKIELFIPSISLKEAPNGVIAIRCWGYDEKNKVLVSLGKGNTKWGYSYLHSDIKPEKGNESGIYAYRLGSMNYFKGGIQGLIALSGKIISHKDGMLRAEKARILILVIDDNKISIKLKEKYNIPIIVSSRPEISISNWMIGNEGIFWLRHNNDIIQKYRFENDIKKILEKQEVKNDDKSGGGVGN